MRKSISQIVAELDQLQMQGVSLTYRQKQQIAKNENVIKGKMSVQDAYMENVSRRTQPVFETVPEQNNALVKLKSGGSLPKMQDAGALMVQTDPVDEPTPEVVVDPVKPSTEDYRNRIQSNYKNILANDYKTPYIKGVTEGGMNCINGVCSLIKKAGAKEFTRGTYTGNATFNDNLENEGYYTIDPTKEAFEIGDIVQYSRKKSRAQRFEGTTDFVTGEELFPQHAKIIADKYVDKDGVTQYVIVHNYGEEKLSKKEISEAELLSHTKGYGSGVKYMDGLLVQRYGPDVVSKNIEEREAKKRVLQGQNEFAKEYNVPVTNISFSKPMQTVEGDNYNKRINKDLGQIYTQNYDKLARMSDVPKSTFDQMLALQAGIQHMESGKGGLRAMAKEAVPDFLLDEARQIMSDSGASTWVDVYWKDNAENVKDKFKTKQEFKNYLNKDNKLSAAAAEWAFYNSPASKGAFQQKELSDRGRFLSLDPNLESYEDQAMASLALMIDNYHKVKKQYPEAAEEELLDLSILMHNAPSKALTPEFYRYFVKNKDVNYVNEVKQYVPKINIDQPQSRELPQEEIDAMKGFIDGLSDAGPQMRYGGSLPDLPKYQNGGKTDPKARKTSEYMDDLSRMDQDSIINSRFPGDIDVAIRRLEEMYPHLLSKNKNYSKEQSQAAMQASRLYLSAPMTDQRRIEREENTVAAKPLTSFELMKRDNVGYFKQPTKMDETGLSPVQPAPSRGQFYYRDGGEVESYQNGGLPKYQMAGKFKDNDPTPIIHKNFDEFKVAQKAFTDSTQMKDFGDWRLAQDEIDINNVSSGGRTIQPGQVYKKEEDYESIKGFVDKIIKEENATQAKGEERLNTDMKPSHIYHGLPISAPSTGKPMLYSDIYPTWAAPKTEPKFMPAPKEGSEKRPGYNIKMPGGITWSKEKYIEKYGQASWDAEEKGRLRAKNKFQNGGLPKYQNGTNPEEVYYGKTLPEVTVTDKLDRTNPTAVRNYNRVNNPIAYAATEATDKFASNYLMPLAEMAPGTGDVMDVANFGNAVYKGDYGTAALYAGFGLLPGTAGPLVEGSKKLGRGIKNAYQEAIFRGVEPLGYGIKRKAKDFIPNLIKNSRRSLDERALDLGYNVGHSSGKNVKYIDGKKIPRTVEEITDRVKSVGESKYTIDPIDNPFPDDQYVFRTLNDRRRIGTDLLDSFNMGLRRKQNWNTFESLGDDVYRINRNRPGTEVGMFRDLSNNLKKYNQHLKRVDQYENDVKELGLEKMSELGIGIKKPDKFYFGNQYGHLEPKTNRFHIEGDNIRGNYTMDVKPSTGPTDPIKFTATDKWDLHPFQKGPLKNLEMLKLFGGKPYTIKNTYDVDPTNFNVLRSYKNGGYLSKYRNRK